MCGISTVVVLPRVARQRNDEHDDQNAAVGEQNTTGQALREEMQTSLDIIKHRGPDASGIWISQNERIGTVASSSHDFRP